MRIPIRVLDKSFKLLAETNIYDSISYSKSHYDIGSLELHISSSVALSRHLIPGNYIMVQKQRDHVYLIQSRVITMTEVKNVDKIKINAIAIDGILMRRICVPQSGNLNVYYGGPADYVMKQYVRSQMGDLAHSHRTQPSFKVADATLVSTDPFVGHYARYSNLAEEIMNLAITHDLGWQVTLDSIGGTYGLLFDTVTGVDRSISQNKVRPVVLSPELGTIKNLSYTESVENFKSFAYIGGPGEGVSRVIIEYANASQYQNDNRFEVFLDGGTDSETIMDAIDVDLKKYSNYVYLEGSLNTAGQYKYGTHFKCGDMLTIRNGRWGLEANVRVTEVKVTNDSNGFEVDITLGSAMPNVFSRIKQDIRPAINNTRR